MLPQLASAYDFEVDGLCYDYNDDGNSVTVTYDTNQWGLHYTNLSGELYLPSSVTYNGTNYSVTSIGNNAFRICGGLTSVIIPNSVTSIGDEAFYGCSGLISLTIPNSVTQIGKQAFLYCSGLTELNLPNSIISFGEYAFGYCSGLISVTWNTKACSAHFPFAYSTNIQFFSFGDEVEILPTGICYGLSELTSITLPNSVTSIGDSSFSGCSGLIELTIPNSVTEIGRSAFSGCSGLTELNLPNSITSFGEYAFSNCSSLTELTIPNSVTTIGWGTFSGCTKIRSIYSKIEDPESVTYGSDIFEGVSKNYCKLYVPAGTVEDYQFTAPWNEFLNILEDGGGGSSSTTPVHGDVNGDGVVTAADVTEIYNILLGNE